MLKNWTNIFLYHIKNNKLFTILNVLGLSIGVAGLIFAILYWNDEHSYNDWNPEKERVFQVVNDQPRSGFLAYNVIPLGETLKRNSSEVESYCNFQPGYNGALIEYSDKKEMVQKILKSEGNFFSFFPFQFTKGNAKNALKNKNSVAISEQTAQLIFGDENPINQSLKIGDKNCVVGGVYKISEKSSVAPAVVLREEFEENVKKNADNWQSHTCYLVLKLKNPNSKEAVEKQIWNIYVEKQARKFAKEKGTSSEEYIKNFGLDKPYLESLVTARLHSKVVNGYPEGSGNHQFLLIMVGLSVLILILSVVNYINLATANAIKRAKEVGVRKIIGATKTQIVFQFVMETVLITLFAVLFALVLVELFLPYYNQFLLKDLVMNNGQFYIQLFLVFVIIIIFAGVFPAIYISNFEVLNVLKGNFSRSKKGIWLRNSMLILQFAIASFFIIGSYIVFQQVNFMMNKDIGFSGNQVLNINLNEPKKPKDFAMIQNELLKIKGIEKVSAGNFSFGFGGYFSSVFTYKGKDVEVDNMSMEFGLLDLMKIKVMQGRDISPKFASDTISSVLVNQATVKMMGEKNPIGKEFEVRDDGENPGIRRLKIVGVVEDFNVLGPQKDIPPMLFYHLKTISESSFLSRIYIKINPENSLETVSEIERFWTTKIDTRYPFSYDFVDKNFVRTYSDYISQRNLFSVLNIVVILIALFGLFALASFSIQNRMKEIAIRKTLGAETNVLLKELSKQYIIYCVIGFLLALFPVYYLLNMWLENFAFRITISVLPFLLGFVILLSLTLVIVLSRAYQATRLDVLKYLKYE
nr:FtsX-like permease family protein [uncultured Flavobacterium sp.]